MSNEDDEPTPGKRGAGKRGQGKRGEGRPREGKRGEGKHGEGKRPGAGGRRQRLGATEGPRAKRRNRDAAGEPVPEAAPGGPGKRRRAAAAADGVGEGGRKKGAGKGGRAIDAETREKRAAARAARAAKRAAEGQPNPAPAPSNTAAADDAQRGTRNPYLTFRRADGPSIAVDARLAERLLNHAIDGADAHFRTHLVASGSVTKSEREAIAKTLAFTRSNAPSPTFREDQFVANAVLLALLQPKLVAAVGANADVLAAAFGASKAKVVAFGSEVDTLSRALGRDAFVDTDFARHDFGTLPDGALVHLGDQMPTARRLLEAEAKGFDAAIVTGSPGLSGVVRQALPPVPTLPMVLAAEHYEVGDVIAWSLRRRRFEAVVTEAMLDEMRRARAIIDRVVPFPALADNIALPLTDKRSSPATLVLFS